MAGVCGYLQKFVRFYFELLYVGETFHDEVLGLEAGIARLFHVDVLYVEDWLTYGWELTLNLV